MFAESGGAESVLLSAHSYLSEWFQLGLCFNGRLLLCHHEVALCSVPNLVWMCYLFLLFQVFFPPQISGCGYFSFLREASSFASFEKLKPLWNAYCRAKGWRELGCLRVRAHGFALIAMNKSMKSGFRLNKKGINSVSHNLYLCLFVPTYLFVYLYKVYIYSQQDSGNAWKSLRGILDLLDMKGILDLGSLRPNGLSNLFLSCRQMTEFYTAFLKQWPPFFIWNL